MPTQKKGYYLADGTRVPSVTTITGRAKESGGLIHWAWKLGTEGKDYREERNKAADSGTLAHAMVEAWVKGGDPEAAIDAHAEANEGTPEEVFVKARQAFENFLEWATGSNLKVSHTEMPLVSERYKFGGTFDAIFVNGKRAMGDWKTSNSLYPEMLMQVRAYGELWNEHHPDDPINGGYHILRFDKNHGDFHHHHWSELDDAWEAFLHIREFYELDKALKKRAA